MLSLRECNCEKKKKNTKKIKADFTVGNACFVANISEGIAHSTGVFLG